MKHNETYIINKWNISINKCVACPALWATPARYRPLRPVPPFGCTGNCPSRSNAGNPTGLPSSLEPAVSARTFLSKGHSFKNAIQGRRSSRPRMICFGPEASWGAKEALLHSPCSLSCPQMAPVSLLLTVAPLLLSIFPMHFWWSWFVGFWGLQDECRNT